MARFNTVSSSHTPVTVSNLAGGNAYQQDKRIELVNILLTSLMKGQYYQTADDTIKRIQALLDSFNESDLLFAAKACVYARNKFGMRSVSHVVAAEIARRAKGLEWTKNFYTANVFRVDDITETIAYFISNYGTTIPNSLKKGLAKAFHKFDSYQLSKYKGEKKGVSLIDAVRLVHPTPNPAITDLVQGKLKSTATWNAKQSEAGKASGSDKIELSKKGWIEFVNNPAVEYFALLRNLKNINDKAPEALDKALIELINPSRIRASKLFPYRFQVAKATLKGMSSRILTAIDKATEIALSNVPRFQGTTLVAVDHSGSMQSAGHNSVVTNAEIASLFAAVIAKTNDKADIMLFGSDAEYFHSSGMDAATTIAKRMIEQRNKVGHGTNLNAIFHRADKKYDRIIILSDMQTWVASRAASYDLKDYNKKFGANPFIYSIDLTGLGTSQFPPGSKVAQVAGFSDKIFDVMRNCELDPNALIHEIEQVTF